MTGVKEEENKMNKNRNNKMGINKGFNRPSSISVMNKLIIVLKKKKRISYGHQQ